MMEHIDPLAKVNLENMELITEIHDLKQQITALQAANKKLVEEKRAMKVSLALAHQQVDDTQQLYADTCKEIVGLEDGKRLDLLEELSSTHQVLLEVNRVDGCKRVQPLGTPAYGVYIAFTIREALDQLQRELDRVAMAKERSKHKGW